MQHITVLLKEAVDALNLKSDSVVVDATFGNGGHGKEIVKILKDGIYIGLDIDETALNREQLGESDCEVFLIHENFGKIKEILSSLNVTRVDSILADLGWRIEQFTNQEKGLSFMHEGPLYMTLGDPDDYPFTAMDIVNEWDESTIADIIYGYSDERFARRIARAIVEVRKNRRIETTTDLAEIVDQAIPYKAKRRAINPATKTFQALRIAVNEELKVLEDFIKDGFAVLKPGGVMAIITFHSIEDRVVKHGFRELVQAGVGELVNKKPITPSQEEVEDNPRARSAKLRVITKNHI
jgi:16S rRNA (cytosine1402-N4)-methyltransferase